MSDRNVTDFLSHLLFYKTWLENKNTEIVNIFMIGKAVKGIQIIKKKTIQLKNIL